MLKESNSVVWVPHPQLIVVGQISTLQTSTPSISCKVFIESIYFDRITNKSKQEGKLIIRKVKFIKLKNELRKNSFLLLIDSVHFWIVFRWQECHILTVLCLLKKFIYFVTSVYLLDF